jgi:hypothetical protein
MLVHDADEVVVLIPGFSIGTSLNVSMNAAPARSLWVFLPGALAAVLPKCPLCFITIAAAMGIELPISARWLSITTVVLVASSVALIAKMAEPRVRRSTVIIAAVGATLIVIGRFAGGAATPLLHGGAAVLILASVRASCRSSCISGAKRCITDTPSPRRMASNHRDE